MCKARVSGLKHAKDPSLCQHNSSEVNLFNGHCKRLAEHWQTESEQPRPSYLNGWSGLAVCFHSCSAFQASEFRFFPCLTGDQRGGT